MRKLTRNSTLPVPCSLFPVPCSLFPVPCSLFPVLCLFHRISSKNVST
ncbi:hypothetical protein [Coleofasciculus sp. E1-EBD-02]